MNQHHQISELLWDAVALLPQPVREAAAHANPVPSGPLQGTTDEAIEFLQNSEYALAWEALAEVARKFKAAAAVWLLLARCAQLMRRPKLVKRAMDQIKSALPREARPGYRLVLERRVRTPEGRVVWRRATETVRRHLPVERD
jgi:hypothetical protein